jgi:hypothetical protein
MEWIHYSRVSSQVKSSISSPSSESDLWIPEYDKRDIYRNVGEEGEEMEDLTRLETR